MVRPDVGDEREEEFATREFESSLWALIGAGWVIP
jgi:hypothetical protein